VARQYLADDGILEPAISDPLAANVATTAVGMYNSLRYALIPAYDSRPGKVYQLEAAGLITTAATGALTISPSLSTTNAAGANSLGASIAQTVPVSSLSGPWFLKMKLVCRTTGDPGGTNSTMFGWGWFISGGVAATPNSGMQITFGGTSCAYDHAVNQSVFISKTLSVAGSWTTQYVDLSCMN
jgi:hypothetical protein